MLPNFQYARPESLDEAIREASAPGTHFHAGGTDLLGCLRDRVFDAGKLVSLSALPELRGISPLGNGGLRIGALTTLTEIAEDRAIQERYTTLAQGAASAASPQLRNQGTIGGNICQRPRCWYFRGDFHCLRKGGDMCYAVAGENEFHCIFGGSACYIVHPSDTASPLVALDAQVRINGPKGSRVMPISEFFIFPERDVSRENVLAQGEIVTDIVLPAPGRGLRSSYRKVRARGSWDFALAGVAIVLHMEGKKVAAGRIILSGVAPAPWTAVKAEHAIAGRVLDAKLAAQAAHAATDGAQPLEQNAYKVDLVRGIVEEGLLAFV